MANPSAETIAAPPRHKAGSGDIDRPLLPLTALERSERRLGALMIAPAFILLFAVVLYPVAQLLITSTQTLRLTEPWMNDPFIGLQNFVTALNDERFWQTTGTTLIFIAITVPGAVVVGLGLALLANQPFRTRWPVRLSLLLPWALPLVFAGLIFRWFFQYNQGIVNNVLVWVGLERLPWLTEPALAIAAISIAIIWKTSSFVALILLAGLQTIPRSLYEAAEIDGATRWQQFIEITLPMLRPAIVVALIFRTITAIQNFDIPYAMTNGGPGNSTETLSMYIHSTTIDFLDLGYGSALAVLMFVVSALVTAGYLRYTRRDPRGGT